MHDSLEQHPDRQKIVEESFARPAQPCPVNHLIARLVMHRPEGAASDDHSHVATLCDQFGCARPAPDARYHQMRADDILIIWERLTEFGAYTVFLPTDGTLSFDANPLDSLPSDWLKALPGKVLSATLINITQRPEQDQYHPIAQEAFGTADFAASSMRGGSAYVAADFHLDRRGFTRFVILDASKSDMVRGRMVQRLFELDLYRLAALLALPVARQAQPEMGRREAELGALLETMAAQPDVKKDREVLHALSLSAAAMEVLGTRTAYRFAAAQAYYTLVLERIERLREDRAEGRERIGVFVLRRLGPAMRTCDAVAARQNAIITQIDRVTHLLAARVEVTVAQQQEGLLHSMSKSGRQQLRLQETVEGLSAIAVTYYGVGILIYVAKGLIDIGLPFPSPTVVGAVAAPIMFFWAWTSLKRIKKRVLKAEAADEK
ncbi:MAG: DUF3422 domain-containing protein [Pseudomonadota bacterium]